MTLGEAPDLLFDSTTGSLSVYAIYSTYQFTITACTVDNSDEKVCVTSDPIVLKVEEFCQNYISFVTWAADTKITGFPNTTIVVHNGRMSYFSTRDESICPVTNLSLDVLSGNSSLLNFDNT